VPLRDGCDSEGLSELLGVTVRESSAVPGALSRRLLVLAKRGEDAPEKCVSSLRSACTAA
jgi:hypothetical protein